MITNNTLPHHLERSVVISARPDVVFTYFTDSSRWASWWGAGSTIDARPGGRLLIRLPGGTDVAGEVLEVVEPQRILFTYGYASGSPIPAGGSVVEIRLEAQNHRTRVHLTHRFAEAGIRDEHVQGWRYQLSVFGNVVTDLVHAGAADTVDAWFAAWSDPDADTRDALLNTAVASRICCRDRFSLIDGVAELMPHLAAVHRFMPGMHVARDGEIRHCQGTVLADWTARTADGQARGRGTTVFVLDADGLIESVTGFWGAAAR
jgi:uncharacterized protein YndB with AHSA1/START domain